MKSLVKLLLIIGLPTMVGMSCQKEDLLDCVKGTVIGYEYCTNAVLIQVSNQPKLGDEIKFYDDVVYSNVVRAPAKSFEFAKGDIYFGYRAYNEENDYGLFKPDNDPCQWFNVPFSVPTIVITDYSTSNCLKSNDNEN